MRCSEKGLRGKIMKMFKVCSECIYDLQRVRRQSENGWNQNLGASTIPWINCKNKPRCFDQPERSKREDLCFGKISQRLEDSIYADGGNLIADLDILRGLVSELKMRCSEHCGNTVRAK